MLINMEIVYNQSLQLDTYCPVSDSLNSRRSDLGGILFYIFLSHSHHASFLGRDTISWDSFA